MYNSKYGQIKKETGVSRVVQPGYAVNERLTGKNGSVHIFAIYMADSSSINVTTAIPALGRVLQRDRGRLQPIFNMRIGKPTPDHGIRNTEIPRNLGNRGFITPRDRGQHHDGTLQDKHSASTKECLSPSIKAPNTPGVQLVAQSVHRLREVPRACPPPRSGHLKRQGCGQRVRP